MPLWTTRGAAENGSLADGSTTTCQTVDGAERCVRLDWPDGWYAYDRAKHTPRAWHGTLLEDKRDAAGTLYRRARHYDPATGRFTQEDPIGLAGGVNLYGFANGDPVNRSDPFGLLSTICAMFGVECGDDGKNRPPEPNWDGGGGTEDQPRNQCGMIGGFLGTNIRQAEQRHKQTASDIFASPYGITITAYGAVIRDLEWFRVRVTDGGPWDYKEQGQSPYFGNWHYGVVGSALGLSAETLLRAAGFNQSNSDAQERNPAWGNWYDLNSGPFGDNPSAQEAIRAGIAWYQRGCR